MEDRDGARKDVLLGILEGIRVLDLNERQSVAGTHVLKPIRLIWTVLELDGWDR